LLKSTPTNGIKDGRKVDAHTWLVQELLVKDSGVVEAASSKGVELPYLFMSEQEVVMGLQYPISGDKGNKCVCSSSTLSWLLLSEWWELKDEPSPFLFLVSLVEMNFFMLASQVNKQDQAS